MHHTARAGSTEADPIFVFQPQTLARQWVLLHVGDHEPWPDAQRAARLRRATGATDDDEALAQALQEGWCDYHSGRFASAHARGAAQGLAGAGLTLRAGWAQAHYVLDGAEARRAWLKGLLPLAQCLRETLADEPNSHLHHARLLAELLATQEAHAHADTAAVQSQHQALLQALQLMPRHGEAQLQLGMFHALVTARMGALSAHLGCATSATAAEHHLELARRLLPTQPRAWLETARALEMLSGRRRAAAVAEALRRAIKQTARDAAAALDIAQARAWMH